MIDPVEDILEWFERGAELVRQLDVRRDLIADQIKTLQDEMRRMEQQLARSTLQLNNGHSASDHRPFPEKILDVLENKSEGLTVSQIQQMVRGNPNRDYLRTTLYRLANQKRIIRVGRRGTYRYQLPTSEI